MVGKSGGRKRVIDKRPRVGGDKSEGQPTFGGRQVVCLS